MYCHEIHIENFRNIERTLVAFDEGVNLLVGDNAQGKTNLLESIYFTAIGKSFRGASSDELIAFGKPCADVILLYHDSIRMEVLAVKIARGKQKAVEQNGVKVRKMTDLVGKLRVVLFVPENLSLVKSGPSERRNWLDVALCQLYPSYMESLSRYNKLLKNRNKLIRECDKDFGSFASTVDFWSEQMAHEAAVMTLHRQNYIDRASVLVDKFFSDMTHDAESVEFVYDPSCGLDRDDCLNYDVLREKYMMLLKKNYDREIAAGSTLWGAHKDDFIIKLNGRSARDFASQGQQRSIALAMKLAEGEICREITGDDPVFLFDDVLSELDLNRRTYLLSGLSGKQVIMTGCDRSFTGDAHVISVENGNYYAEDDIFTELPAESAPEPNEDEDMKII
jgi:DNA replication and repair protein RecF